MNHVRLERFSYRFAEQVLNSKLAIKQEVEDILTGKQIEVASLSRPNFNKILRESFVAKAGKINLMSSLRTMIQPRRWIS